MSCISASLGREVHEHWSLGFTSSTHGALESIQCIYKCVALHHFICALLGGFSLIFAEDICCLYLHRNEQMKKCPLIIQLS